MEPACKPDKKQLASQSHIKRDDILKKCPGAERILSLIRKLLSIYRQI